MRILYVEDNEVNRALVERIMRARKCEVIFRDEGEGALEVLKNDPDVDLVLLDIELAGAISGLDVIRTLRARNDRRPVVAITAYAMMGDRERILEAGCDQYLPKPLVVTDLLAMIDHYEKELAAKAAAPAAAPKTPAASAPPSPPPKAAPKPADGAAKPPSEAAKPPATAQKPSPPTQSKPEAPHEAPKPAAPAAPPVPPASPPTPPPKPPASPPAQPPASPTPPAPPDPAQPPTKAEDAAP